MRREQPVIEPHPGCGLVKTGPGTLVVGGNLKLTGVVTVEQGILDLTDVVLLASLPTEFLG